MASLNNKKLFQTVHVIESVQNTFTSILKMYLKDLVNCVRQCIDNWGIYN